MPSRLFPAFGLLIMLLMTGYALYAQPTIKNKRSLTVNKEGILYKSGKPYHGIGVNYFNAFSRTLQGVNEPDTSYRSGFRYLKERNIPFIRFLAGGFWPVDYQLYQKNKALYFKLLDDFVQAAEAHDIGLIPTLCWNFSTIPDLMQETVNQWGNPQSKTIAFMRQYVKEVVSRYKNSPGVWGWEFGNEYNLETDLPGDHMHLPQIAMQMGTAATRSKADKLSTRDLQVALHEFALSVRQYDKHRIIISGNAIPRASAWHLYHYGKWEKDTKAQYQEMLALLHPDPVNTISIHLYPDNSFDYFADEAVSISRLMKINMDAAVRYKKPLFIGEFGAAELKLGKNASRKQYMELINALVENKVPLAAMWVFDYPPHNEEGEGINVSTDNGPREYMLKAIQEANLRLQQD